MTVQEMVRVPLPTPMGLFEARAFQLPSGQVYLALVMGDAGDRDGQADGAGPGDDVLVRLHSECLTGDALGSLRCDCGVQLRLALRIIAAHGQGVLVYATGQEGRGIGLVNKLRAYVEQDLGADTVDANVRLSLPVDNRSYGDSAAVLQRLGIRSVRLLTNNPSKVQGLRAAGIAVHEMVPLTTAPHNRNRAYLRAKERRLGHVTPAGPPLADAWTDGVPESVDATPLVGEIRPPADRPYVVLKFAQTLDGRIATATGDSKWISGEAERRVSHALRAACDGVLVGIGTVLQDDPQLTVRMVAGTSPMRLVLDSTLRIPSTAKVLGPEAATTIITSERAAHERRTGLAGPGVRVEVVPPGPGGVDLAVALRRLREAGITTVLVEGGGKVITSMLAQRVVDRLVVGIAPLIIGAGTDAVGRLGVDRVVDGIRLVNRSVYDAGEDVLVAGDIAP